MSAAVVASAPVEGSVQLISLGAKGGQAQAALRNISEIGCLVTTKHIVTPGTELKLALNVGDYDLALKGQVGHAEQQVGLGIEFRAIRKGERQMLQFLLQKLGEKRFEERCSLKPIANPRLLQ